MGLIYNLEKKGNSLFVSIQEQGFSKKVLYLDSLKKIASESDREILSLLIKIQLKNARDLQTVTFDRIAIPTAEVLNVIRLIKATGRMMGRVEEKQNLPLQLTPELRLKDMSGMIADLWMDYGIEKIDFQEFAPKIDGRERLWKIEEGFEKDLIDAGFAKKSAHYICPFEKVKEALSLLIGLGWKVIDARGCIVNQEIKVSEKGNTIAIRAQLRAWIDPELQMSGVWEGDTLYVKRGHVGLAAELLKGENIHWDEKIFQAAKEFREIPLSLPTQNFRGSLFPYQQKGVDFLTFLHKWGFSALLADEMGLGKTVQVLAFLSRLEKNLPVLVVAPTTLLFNWRSEIKRFLPEREIELVSYTSLRLNIEAYEHRNFEVIILDESNAIKTASTQTAKAVCRLKGSFKICLTGTPMENRLDELWSQFQFLMPHFLKRSADPQIVKRAIRSFILRRKKEQVQIDLPAKIEQTVLLEMGEEQKRVYDSYKKGIRLDGADKMQVLEAILRLRQICVDPRLVGAEEPGVKIQQLISDVEELVNEGRKILIYSSFTAMLKLIQKTFTTACYLDGKTSKREEQVRRFQEGDELVFLISLKAGGVGLNLTAADHVFLMDPWWNIAVENQAIDRAHRLGQKNTVFAKRYVTVGTIEEKMLQLKSKKQQAADQLLDFDGGNICYQDLIDLLS